MDNKIKALAEYLGESVENLRNNGDNCVQVVDGFEYLVLTEDEADEVAAYIADARRKFVADYNARMAALERMPEKEQACPKVELVSYDEPYKIRYEAVLNGHRKYIGSYYKGTKFFASSVLDIVREDTCARESQETLERIIRFANSVSEGIL